MTHLVLHWSHQSIIVLYMHEACHRMPGWAPGDDEHDCVFAALLRCLLTRCDDAGLTDGAALTLGLYELQDPPLALAAEPDGGIGRSMTWSITTAHGLAGSDLSAEEIAVEIRRRYDVWLDELAQEPVQVARAKAAAVARAQAVVALREKLFFRNVLIVGLSVLVVVMFGLMVRLAVRSAGT